MRSYPAWLQRLLRQLGGTAPLFYALPWMMLLLVFATTEQKRAGLHAAVETYLDSWILWLGPLPLPGGLPMLCLAVLSLMARLIWFTRWEWRQSGVVMAHLGALFLLAGSWYVSATAQEGFIALQEGESQSYAEAYTDWQLVLLSQGRPVHAWPLDELSPHARLENGPVGLTVTQLCAHCALLPGPGMGRSKDYAQMFRLDPQPAPVLEEERSPALTLTAGGREYLLHALLPKPATLEAGYQLRLRRARHPLPFSLELQDFTRSLYPGSQQAREYASTVQVRPVEGGSWRQVIAMNEPLRYRGYAVYQASYIQTPEAELSVLAVVKNRGWLIPYLAGGLMGLGLLLHGWQRRSAAPLAACLLAALAAMPQPTAAAPDLSAFRQIPVAHEGRVKPLDSFARYHAARFGGVVRDPAQWLAITLFDPAQAMRLPFMRLADPAFRAMLELPAREDHRYSPAEIAAALQRHGPLVQAALAAPADALTAAQRQLLTLYGNSQLYEQLAGSLTLLLPLQLPPDADRSGIGLPDRPIYLDLRRIRQQLLSQAQEQSDNPASPVLQLANLLRLLELQGSQPQWLRILPSPWRDAEWSAPWEIVQNGQGSPRINAYLYDWRQMAQAWLDGDTARFAAASDVALQHALAISDYPAWRLRAEMLYNRLNPLYWTGGFYLLCLLALLAARKRPRFLIAACYALAGGMVLHLLGMGLRVAILQRPPVANLYESILFVAAIAAGYGLAGRDNPQRLAIGAGLALALLLASIGFTPSGDTLLITLAVLNTNFWLTVHVLCITAGYAACLLAAVQAHLWLWQADPARPSPLTLAIIALALTATGTWLGGIWADQSWGRFWGWDPKENGALLIALWLIWILHGRLGRHLSPLTYHSGLALTALIVALSWFGVNLLSVGLHAYGFTDRAAWGLGAYGIAQLAIVTILAYRFQRRNP